MTRQRDPYRKAVLAPRIPPPPASLYPTKTRLALLRDVADGEVWQDLDGESVRTAAQSLGVSDPVERVTARIAEAEQAGWVRVAELRHGARQWQLTDAGLAVLDGAP